MILYASETGTAEDLAEDTQKQLASLGHDSLLCNSCDVESSQLKDVELLLAIVSTWGEGEPPTDAEDFFEELCQAAPIGLTQTQLAVFALGDTAYEDFCQYGIDLEKELQRHGATSILKRVDCDFYYEDEHKAWMKEVVALLNASGKTLVTS